MLPWYWTANRALQIGQQFSGATHFCMCITQHGLKQAFNRIMVGCYIHGPRGAELPDKSQFYSSRVPHAAAEAGDTGTLDNILRHPLQLGGQESFHCFLNRWPCAHSSIVLPRATDLGLATCSGVACLACRVRRRARAPAALEWQAAPRLCQDPLGRIVFR